MTSDRTVLDEVDREILYHLQSDARTTTNAEISDRADVAATTVGQRIDDLRAEGVIKTCHATLNYERGGFPHRMLLFCTVQPADRREAAEAVMGRRGVISVRELITGERNLHVEIVGRTRDEITDAIGAIESAGVDVVDSEVMKSESRTPFDGLRTDRSD